MQRRQTSSWTFLTNHTQVLVRIAQDPDVRLKDIADTVGITERAAQRLVADLVERASSPGAESDDATTT